MFADRTRKRRRCSRKARKCSPGFPMYTLSVHARAKGLRAAEVSVQRQIRVNVTLCFSQDQTAAVYEAGLMTAPKTHRPGQEHQGDVQEWLWLRACSVLAASIRHVDHLLASFAYGAELTTVPAKVLEDWATKDFSMSDKRERFHTRRWISTVRGRTSTSSMNSQPRVFRSLWLIIGARSDAQHRETGDRQPAVAQHSGPSTAVKILAIYKEK